MSIFTKVETFSNHGTQQGIIPRFELQMINLYKFAFLDSKEYEFNKFIKYTEVVVPEITHLYDIHLSIVQKIDTYTKGMISGEFCNLKGGIPHFDRTIELQVIDLVKDFFVRGRILLQNFRKSEIIDDNYFCLGKLLLVSDNNFQRNKQEQKDSMPDNTYDPLFDLIEISKTNFLNEFNKIRADFEHNQQQLNKYDFNFSNNTVVEPEIENKKISTAIDFYYENILEMIEKLMCYFYGIKAGQRSNGNLKLYLVKDYDYTKVKNKYMLSPLKFDNLIECDYN